MKSSKVYRIARSCESNLVEDEDEDEKNWARIEGYLLFLDNKSQPVMSS